MTRYIYILCFHIKVLYDQKETREYAKDNQDRKEVLNAYVHWLQVEMGVADPQSSFAREGARLWAKEMRR